MVENGGPTGEEAGGMRHEGLLIGGEWVQTSRTLDVIDKYHETTFATVSAAEARDVEAAVDAAVNAFRRGPLPPRQRAEILLEASRRLAEMKEEAALTIAREAGKPLQDARTEVDRACETLRLSAEEAKRIRGEMVPVEAAPGSENRLAFTLRRPRGVVAAITPFNFPLNLVCHKVGPALAAGNTVVLKPASSTPLSAILLCRILMESGLPAGYLNLVAGSGKKVGEVLLNDPRVAYYSFTGSAAVGKHIRKTVGLRPVTLELGGNAATIVCDDADLELAVERCVRGAFANAGQVCISVQRILVDRKVWDDFVPAFVQRTEALVVGDPTDPATEVGPLISAEEGDRIARWVSEAGGRILTGGKRRGPVYYPTVLTDVSPRSKLVCEEAFGPVVTLQPFDTFAEAIEAANDTKYGLQGGIFTESLERAMAAARQIRVGGLIVNDTSNYRADLMPYGGLKESGLGKEGPRYAVEAMTEETTVVFNLRGAR